MMADKRKRKIVLVVIVVSLVVVGALVWHQRQEPDKGRVNVPLYSLDTGFNTDNARKDDGKAQEAALKKVGIEIQDKPRHYVTTTEQQGDDIARQTAAKEGADYVVKQHDTAPAIVATDDSKDKDKGQQTTVYNNTYYAVHQEKKHDIKAGVAVVDNKAAAVIMYRNREMSYSVYTDGHRATGAAVQYTICKW